MRQPDEERLPSRSDRKRADKPFQELARRLAALSEDACRALATPDGLKEEILSAVRTQAHGARNRQIKRLASLLRKQQQEAEALHEALSSRTAIHSDELQTHKGLEMLRERICAPEQTETAVAEAVLRFPSLDRKHLHRLSRAAHTAKGTGDRRAYREIFRQLRRAQETELEASGSDSKK